jgi:alpha-galactosidase
MPTFDWDSPHLRLSFATSQGRPVRLVSIKPAGQPSFDTLATIPEQPLVEVSAFGHGRFPGSFRHVDTVLGAGLRYVRHENRVEDGTHRLSIEQVEPTTGLRAVSVFEAHDAVAAFRTWTVLDMVGDGELTVDFVSSFASGCFLPDSGSPVDDLDLVAGDNDWVAESRWSTRPLREVGLARIDRDVQHQPPRSRAQVTNRGSWSTGEKLPTAAVVSRTTDYAIAWQIEHNGPWTYELGETRHGAYLLLSGPTDQEHQWSTRISASRSFTSVPVSVGVVSGGIDDAFAVLTDQRRAIRANRAADRTMPIVFNDYMNTLMGDPTTAKLLPLIDAAADAGADYFCIDAGWYAEGHWWDTVGEWQPAASRFPGGIAEVIGRIRDRGMVAGLWLEPEVIGVNSPLAASLPDDAFFSRGGIRWAEHGRHLLDLRSPAAVDHLNRVVDRLIDDYGVGFFKLDYNTMTGAGTDATADSPGDGLLQHSRALLRWLDDVQARHPQLLIENCASGAMRMDYAMMARLHIQSTSDQQDPVMYAPIAAAAPASLLPEQAGNWAYPQAGMDSELFTFSLCNAILGRMYLSGYLNRMSERELSAVREAVAAQRTVLETIETSHAVWPLGLPGWEDGWVALGLKPDAGSRPGMHLTLWRRPGSDDRVVLSLPVYRDRELEVDAFFPRQQHGWSWTWDAAAAELTVTAAVPAPSARVLFIHTP